MIDLHSHIMPGVDDGSPDMSVSCSMLRYAAEDGISCIAATPHYSQSLHEVYAGRLAALQECGKANGIRIVGGIEYDLNRLAENMPDDLQTLGESRYILTDINSIQSSAAFIDLFFRLHLRGYKIIFAHPERMFAHRRFERLLPELAKFNIYIQINSGSLLGLYGNTARINAEYALRHGFCHLLGNDAHKGSSFRFSLCRKCMESCAAPGDFELLTRLNPERVLRNEPLTPCLGHNGLLDKIKDLIHR